ncbi:MAG: Hpt domain-containing protein [Solirubrobacteraceae bacterium]
MNDLLQTVWMQSEGTVTERIALVSAAVEHLLDGRLRDQERRCAAAAAHKLAGSLGLFGLHRAGEAARVLEIQLERDGSPGPEQRRIMHEELAMLGRAREDAEPGLTGRSSKQAPVWRRIEELPAERFGPVNLRRGERPRLGKDSLRGR